MLHIIAGQYKGRKLLPPPGSSITRPITGLAKKSLFDILAPNLPQAVVIDLYCGTGTLGLEAMSRGAGKCYFAERDPAVIDRLKRNISAIGIDAQCAIWRGNIVSMLRAWLNGLAGKADIVFVDPPYADTRQWSWDKIAADIFIPLAERLAPDGIVVLRLPDRAALPEKLGPLVVRRQKKYGDMLVVLMGHGKSAEGGSL